MKKRLVKPEDPACFDRDSEVVVLQGFTASRALKWIEDAIDEALYYKPEEAPIVPVILVENPTDSTESEIRSLRKIGARVMSGPREVEDYLGKLKAYSPPKKMPIRRRVTGEEEEDASWVDFTRTINTSW